MPRPGPTSAVGTNFSEAASPKMAFVAGRSDLPSREATVDGACGTVVERGRHIIGSDRDRRGAHSLSATSHFCRPSHGLMAEIIARSCARFSKCSRNRASALADKHRVLMAF